MLDSRSAAFAERITEADRLDALFAAVTAGSTDAPPTISHPSMQQPEGVH
ncbi:hypothetical protein JSE7799_01752 [Jannaschia seosinensis]|uniref:Uncharacterized protein n=1 Tax=Jannaschia seosinensis TaxID=313367 RepID=A0A0M7BAT4_9RHOB|nr:hypothetical protein [Jannaschia seosinensis]CUH39033.1 hypothetical protein JSE7799_01752 [Jannaschia seosinensis]